MRFVPYSLEALSLSNEGFLRICGSVYDIKEQLGIVAFVLKLTFSLTDVGFIQALQDLLKCAIIHTLKPSK